VPTNLVIRKHWQSDVVSSCSAAVHAVCYAINNARTGYMYVDTMRPYIHSRTFPVGTVWTPLSFLPSRRHASADTSYGPVSVSVTSRRSIETAEKIGLVFGTGASFGLSDTVLEILIPSKNKGTSFWNFTLNFGLRKFRHLEACY